MPRLTKKIKSDNIGKYFHRKPPSAAQIKKRNAEQTKVFKAIITTALLAKENLEINKTPARMKKNVSIATKTANEICKQNNITDETLSKMWSV